MLWIVNFVLVILAGNRSALIFNVVFLLGCFQLSEVITRWFFNLKRFKR
jgi:hypothetical protein